MKSWWFKIHRVCGRVLSCTRRVLAGALTFGGIIFEVGLGRLSCVLHLRQLLWGVCFSPFPGTVEKDGPPVGYFQVAGRVLD